jgi:predicted permease
MLKTIYSLAIIASGLTLGYLLKHLLETGRIKLPWNIPALRLHLQKIALWYLMSLSFLAAIWSLKSFDPRLGVMPLIGASVILSSSLMGWMLGRYWNLPPAGKGALFSVSAMFNIGSIGALVAYVYLGEASLALVPLYKLFEEVIYYSICFPIAKSFGPMARTGEAPLARLRSALCDPFVLTAVGAMALGGALNIAGVPRPGFMSTVSAICVPAGTFLLLTSIGLALNFTRMTGYLKQCLGVMGIKFLAAPLIACGLGWLLGLGDVDDGLPLKVLLVLGCMPVGFNAMIPPSIYKLDLNLANACWLATTAGMALVLPILYWLLQII